MGGPDGASGCYVADTLSQLSAAGCFSSCFGYGGITPTAAAPTSWGKLKLICR